MNTFEATTRMIEISENLTRQSEMLSRAVFPDRRNLVEKEINILEVGFFSIKHSLEKIKCQSCQIRKGA